MDSNGESGPPKGVQKDARPLDGLRRRSFLDRDLRSVRHDHRRFQHQANQGDDPWVLHAFRDPGQQALMMNSVEELGQVEINHCLIAILQISELVPIV